MQAELKRQAERYLGTEIEPSEWDEARLSAEQKLIRIIRMYGDEGGARREPWYLAQLIAESVKSIRISSFTSNLMELYRYDDEQRGKKGQPVRYTHRPPTTLYPYCNIKNYFMQ